VVLSGPSGVGKGTVVSRAMAARNGETRRLRRSVSVTTRQRRGDEQEARDYLFVTCEEFGRMVASGDLLESATYLDHSYGTPREWVDSQLAAGCDVVLEIEVQGAMQVRSQRPEAVLVYMLPPSWAILRRRLARRRSESPETQERRLQVAREETRSISRYDYVIVNRRVSQAARLLLSILAAERSRVARTCISDVL